MMRFAPPSTPRRSPGRWGLTAIFYGNFAWFREQLCIGLCPYGRLQSVLIDKDSLVVGYDEKRGEPRGPKGRVDGDCIDCGSCVVVCPTGIDIRNGAAARPSPPTPATRSWSRSASRSASFATPRSVAEGAPPAPQPPRLPPPPLPSHPRAEASVFVVPRRSPSPLSAFALLRVRVPFVVEGPLVKNAFTIHLVNKSSQKMRYVIEPEASAGLVFNIPLAEPEVESMSGITLPVTITSARAGFVQRGIRIKIRNVTTGKSEVMATGTLLGPMGGM